MSNAVDTSKVNTIQNTPSRKPFRILSLDGGGVRAIIQTSILKRIQESFPTVIDEVDMFVGVSAGSIVAAALSCGLSASQTYDMFLNTAPLIFSQNLGRKLRTIDSLIGASYDTESLASNLSKTIGDKTIGDLPKKLMIPSFNLDPPPSEDGTKRWAPEYFHNLDNSTNKSTLVLDAVMRSAAAPTYFPIREGYVDGGTFANNPVLAAVSIALENGIKLEDITVLSISTGNNPKCISKAKFGDGNWGLAEWGPHLIDLLLDSSTETIDFTTKCLLKDQYMRIDPVLTQNIGLDDATQLTYLDKIANEIDLSKANNWLERYWKVDDFTPIESITDSLISSNLSTPVTDPTKPGYCNII